MAIISLYGNTVGGSLGSGSFSSLGNAFNTAKQSTNNLTKELGTLKTKINAVSGSVNLSSSGECVSKSIKREEQKQGNLSLAYDKLDQLISDTSAVDSKAAAKVEEIKSDFYAKYSYLKPTSEYNWWDWTKEGAKSLWNGICSIGKAIGKFASDVVKWCKENWKSILSVVLVICATVALVIVAVATFGAAAVLVAALVGAAVGVVSQLIGDLVSFAITGKWTGSWQSYVGAALGGAVGGIVGLFTAGMGGPVVKLLLKGGVSALEAGVSTFFSGNLSNITGGEKKSFSSIVKDTAFNSILSGVSAIAFDKPTKAAGKYLSKKVPALSRLSGRGSYSATYEGTLKKLSDGTVKKITYKTVRNGIVSGVFENSFQSVFQGVVSGCQTKLSGG